MPENSIFDGPITNLLLILYILIETISCAHAKGGKSLNDFKFGTFVGCFPSDSAASVAVKGLKDDNLGLLWDMFKKEQLLLRDTFTNGTAYVLEDIYTNGPTSVWGYFYKSNLDILTDQTTSILNVF